MMRESSIQSKGLWSIDIQQKLYKNTTKVVAVCYNPAHFPGKCPSHEHWPTRRASIHSVGRCPAHNLRKMNDDGLSG